MEAHLSRVGCFFAVTVTLSACTLASPTYVTTNPAAEEDEDDKGTKTKSDPNAGTTTPAPGAGACTAPFVKVDINKLTPCKEGKGHCYPKTKVPGIGPMLIACPNAAEVCVPDEVLTAGGDKLKTCKSVLGAGACFTSSLMPDIAANGGGALTKDVCDADQQCMPCTDPRNNNAPTPFCQAIGVSEQECAATPGGTQQAAPATPSQTCCTQEGVTSGVCIAESAVPEKQRDDTKQDTCPAANKCVPRMFVSGKPIKCNSGIMGAGVCMAKCFNDLMGFAGDMGLMSTAGCGRTEVCVPCMFGKDQGMPGCE
jgi:hypothetical protein